VGWPFAPFAGVGARQHRYSDRDIFEAFLKLPVSQRKLIREIILTFAKVHGDTKALAQE
jgi:hypothetical protein